MQDFQSLADFLSVPDVSKPPEERSLVHEPLPEDVTPRDFALGILRSTQYRESLLRRILMDELPPAVEVLLYHYGHGKPPDKIELGGINGKPIEVTRRVIDPAQESS